MDVKPSTSRGEPWEKALSSTLAMEYTGRIDYTLTPTMLLCQAQSRVQMIQIRKSLLLCPFMTCMDLRNSHSYECVNASAYGTSNLCIAVPSRLYFTRTSELPLAGVRISIKDIFHLKGVVTTHGNRAYADLYGIQHVNSASVQDVIDKGAIIVGKTKTAEFAGSQEVEGDWADYSCPKNPRADGYLRSTGSSTGSASSVASYSWLDGSLGSDGMPFQ